MVLVVDAEKAPKTHTFCVGQPGPFFVSLGELNQSIMQHCIYSSVCGVSAQQVRQLINSARPFLSIPKLASLARFQEKHVHVCV